MLGYILRKGNDATCVKEFGWRSERKRTADHSKTIEKNNEHVKKNECEISRRKINVKAKDREEKKASVKAHDTERTSKYVSQGQVGKEGEC